MDYFDIKKLRGKGFSINRAPLGLPNFYEKKWIKNNISTFFIHFRKNGQFRVNIGLGKNNKSHKKFSKKFQNKVFNRHTKWHQWLHCLYRRYISLIKINRIPLLTTLPLIARYWRQAHPLSITGVFDVNVEQLQIVKSTR